MSLETHYIRTSPDGIISHIYISNQKFLEYHRDLKQNHGFKYMVKPVIHVSENQCQSCEG